MSSTHFEIPRALIYKIGSFLLLSLIGVTVYSYQADRESQNKAIKTNQEAIHVSTQQILKNDKGLAVLGKDLEGHKKTPDAHKK
jgi:hypothetical protein